MSSDFATCDECHEPVHVDEWDDHACPDPDYDPAEPWMDPDIWIDDSDEEVGA